MEQTDYTKLVPFTPPEGLLEWAKQKDENLQKNVLVYKQVWETNPISGLKHKAIEGWCSACGQVAGFDYYSGAERPGFLIYDDGDLPTMVKSGDELFCPDCGAKVRAVHCGTFRHTYFLGASFPMTVGRVEDKLVVTGWRIGREVCKKNGNYRVDTDLHAYEAYVVERRKLVRLRGYDKYMFGLSYRSGWAQNRQCRDEWGETSHVFPWDPALLEGSTAEHSALDRYLQIKDKCRPLSYLKLWIKHRNVENLVMQGAGKLLNSLMEGTLYSTGYYGKAYVGNIGEINWAEVRPAQMLGVNKEEFRRIVRMRLDRYGLNMIVQLKKLGCPLRNDEETKLCKDFGPLGVVDMAKKGEPFLKMIRYINRQSQKYPGEKSKIAASVLEDYWDMAQKVGDDLQDPKVRWPQHLIGAHDAILLRMKWKEEKTLQPKFTNVLRELSQYSFEDDGIVIFPCACQSDLIREGKVLDHCVARYAESHAEGKRCIFFIRRAEAQEIPWYTLELDVERKTVLQNRGKRNCEETREVKAFREKWLEFIRSLPDQKERKVS